MSKVYRLLGILSLVAVFLYLSGPVAEPFSLELSIPNLPSDRTELDAHIAEKESQYMLKMNNQAEILWQDDSSKAITDISLVYLHGFSASKGEGFPTHLQVAQELGANMYLARLQGHGLYTTEALLDFNAEAYIQSAYEAILIGKKLGRKTFVLATSTGCSAALTIASRFPGLIDGLVMYSPNIRINDPYAWALTQPYGLQMARLFFGGNYRSYDAPDEIKQYWDTKYRLEATVELQRMIDGAMNSETFEKVSCPVFMGYYYQDEDHQDPVVRVDAMLEMFERLGSADKTKIAFPNNHDHVILSSYKTDNWYLVKNATTQWISARTAQ